MAFALKDQGNIAFKTGNFDEAKRLYTEAIAQCKKDESDLRAMILTNRAATHLKTENYVDAHRDCSDVLEINPGHTKALYRSAQANVGLNDFNTAYKVLSKLLHIEPKNPDGILLMKVVKKGVEQEKANASQIGNILSALQRKELSVVDSLRGLIGLCCDDKYNAIDLGKRGGLLILRNFFRKENQFELEPSLRIGGDFGPTVAALRVLGASSLHKDFVAAFLDIPDESNMSSLSEHLIPCTAMTALTHLISTTGKLNFLAMCRLMGHFDAAVAQASISLLLHVLQALPVSRSLPVASFAPASVASSVEASAKQKPDDPQLFLCEDAVKAVLRGLNRALISHDSELFSLAVDAFNAFISDSPEYFSAEKIVDTRMESLEERKERMKISRLNKKRSKLHATLAIEIGVLDVLAELVDAENSLVRQRSGVCVGRLINAVDDEPTLKTSLQKFVVHCEPSVIFSLPVLPELIELENELAAESKAAPTAAGATAATTVAPTDVAGAATTTAATAAAAAAEPRRRTLTAIEVYRRRAGLQSALFISNRPELGSWALEQAEGVKQLLVLVASCDPRCQEVASEVMCLAANTETGGPLLAPVLSSGALQTLMQSPNAAVRAAAAATMTKLSIKAKALSDDASDLTQILGTVLSVLKAATGKEAKPAAPSSSAAKGQGGADSAAAVTTVSFSRYDNTAAAAAAAGSTTVSPTGIAGTAFGAGAMSKSKGSGKADSAARGARTFESSLSSVIDSTAYVSTERAIEVLASLVGRTQVKEELVHGSFRVAPAVPALLALELDVRSTAAYGVAHILACLTVSNHELRAKALAEKDMSPEQFAQLQELQRIKTKDEEGNPLEEKKEPDDPDSPELVRKRIQRLVSLGAIRVLVPFITDASSQTRDAAARAIRQICVDEGSRGLVIQQGGLKACCSTAVDEGCTKELRREAAHAVAKVLITTNPTLLSEHARSGAIKPLLLLCREVDASNLQQFEALLALTNLISCGQAEQDLLVKEKGVASVHYLMFSDHLMVRRAATEALCNMASNEAVLKILRNSDMARLWLSLAEDWARDLEDSDGEEEEGAPVIAASSGGSSAPSASAGPAAVPVEDSEGYKTSRAAAGTLAAAASDAEVCSALLKENCAQTVTTLLQSAKPELVHRALVCMYELASTGGRKMARHLVAGGVVPAIGIVTRLGIGMLTDLAKEVASALSQAMSQPADPSEDDKEEDHQLVTAVDTDCNTNRFEELD